MLLRKDNHGEDKRAREKTEKESTCRINNVLGW